MVITSEGIEKILTRGKRKKIKPENREKMKQRYSIKYIKTKVGVETVDKKTN